MPKTLGGKRRRPVSKRRKKPSKTPYDIHVDSLHRENIEKLKELGRYPFNRTDGERAIASSLVKLGYRYVAEKVIEGLKYDIDRYRVADFYLPHENIYIEHLGRWPKDKARYQEKMRVYAQNGIKCIYIYPNALNNITFILKTRIKEVQKDKLKPIPATQPITVRIETATKTQKEEKKPGLEPDWIEIQPPPEEPKPETPQRVKKKSKIKYVVITIIALVLLILFIGTGDDANQKEANTTTNLVNIDSDAPRGFAIAKDEFKFCTGICTGWSEPGRTAHIVPYEDKSLKLLKCECGKSTMDKYGIEGMNRKDFYFDTDTKETYPQNIVQIRQNALEEYNTFTKAS
ncbi:MAG: hypothetical protein KKG59_06620 [Nanoarchaeota archaeon]|nr:hypothetical protein [Nanoarchaeota archaeon]